MEYFNRHKWIRIERRNEAKSLMYFYVSVRERRLSFAACVNGMKRPLEGDIGLRSLCRISTFDGAI